jgi:hypothetical protein
MEADDISQFFAKMQAHCAEHHSSPREVLKQALDRLIKGTSERWDVLDLSAGAHIEDFKRVLSHLKAFGAKEEDVKKYDAFLGWYGTLPNPSLASVPKELRAYARVIRYLLWIEDAEADKPGDAYALLNNKLFTKEVWDQFRALAANTKVDDIQEIVDLVKGLAIFNNNTSFAIIRTSFEVLKSKHDQLEKGSAVFPPSVLNWACGQVVKMAVAANVDELTAVLRDTPYTRICTSLVLAQSKTSRKLLKALRAALFARYDELV